MTDEMSFDPMNEERRYSAKELQAAFVEGFEAGADHQNMPYKYPRVGLAWLTSNTRDRALAEDWFNDPDIMKLWDEWDCAPHSKKPADQPLEEL